MIGSQADPGIMVRVMDDLFTLSKSQGTHLGVHYKVSVSFLEVYNENIRDLLSDVEEYLDLREDPIKGPVVASITEIEATSGQEIMQLLHQGNAKRSQAATAANEVSSRSHAVLQVVVECRDRAPGTVANIKVGKLSLVDLAGSERAANTKNVGQRLVEGANINRSLLALGNCINALGEKGNKGNFVPYRDSKLTRLLKDSLGGNCRTVMIANISSAESSFEETLNTLKYANRAKNIKTNVQRNVLNVNYHISEYVELINNLRSEIQVLKNQLGSVPSNISDRVPTSSSHRFSGENQLNPSSSASALNHHGNNGAGPTSALSLHPPRALSPMMGNAIAHSPYVPNRAEPSTPMEALRESLKSGAANMFATGSLGGGDPHQRELINNMRQRIVDNFQERMQLRRSLIELEDQNVQNSIEVSKRQLIVVQWSEKHGNFLKKGDTTKADFAAYIMANGTGDVMEAWQECEQLRKAIIKNNGMKKNIAKRLRHNEKEAEKFREELSDNVTSEDRRELMALQYQVGRLELENMELEQHRIVHESILKGKDLVIQKLKLQLAVRDKLINRQQTVLKEHNLDQKVGYEQLALMEETLMGNDHEMMTPPSPPRNVADILSDIGSHQNSSNQLEISTHDLGSSPDDSSANNNDRKGSAGKHRHRRRNGAGHNHNKPQVPRLHIQQPEKSEDEGNHHHRQQKNNALDYEEIPITEREIALTSRDRDLIEQGDWSEIQSELSDQSFSLGHHEGGGGGGNHKSHPRNHHHNRHHRNQVPSQQQQPPQSQPHPNERNNDVSSKAAGNLKAEVVGIGSKLSSIKEPKGVHGPRGGRVYRSSANNVVTNNNSSNNNSSNASDVNNNKDNNKDSNGKAGNRLNFQNNLLINHDDISDDDSINQRFQSKYRHYHSPRGHQKGGGGSGSLDKLEPIMKEADEKESGGVFSGRKIDREISHSNSISPRENFAAVYPASVVSNSNSKKSRDEAMIFEGGKGKAFASRQANNNNGNNNANNNNLSKWNNLLLNQDGEDSVELVDIKENHQSHENNNNNNNSGGPGLVIKSKPIGSKAILSKIKGPRTNSNATNSAVSDGNLSSLPSAASLVGGGNNVSDGPVGSEGLNILGSGFEGMSGNRPSNRINKPAMR